MQYTGEKQNFHLLRHKLDFQNSHTVYLDIWCWKGKMPHFSPVILVLVLINRCRLHMQIRWTATESIFLDWPDLCVVETLLVQICCVLCKPLKCVFNLFQTWELKVLEGPHYLLAFFINLDFIFPFTSIRKQLVRLYILKAISSLDKEINTEPTCMWATCTDSTVHVCWLANQNKWMVFGSFTQGVFYHKLIYNIWHC